MSSLSTRAFNGSNITNSKDGTMTSNSVNDRDPSSYSLDRFLSDMDRNHPPGYRQAQSPAYSKSRTQEILRNFDANFLPLVSIASPVIVLNAVALAKS